MAESEKVQRVSDSIAEGEEIDSFVTESRTGCNCFPCFWSRRPDVVGLTWSEQMPEIRNRRESRCSIRDFIATKKLREWSEIVAGPRWKTFIRRFNRTKNPTARQGKFQYDPLSYALNFEDGLLNSDSLKDDLSDYGGFRNFPVRYASVSSPPTGADTVTENYSRSTSMNTDSERQKEKAEKNDISRIVKSKKKSLKNRSLKPQTQDVVSRLEQNLVLVKTFCTRYEPLEPLHFPMNHHRQSLSVISSSSSSSLQAHSLHLRVGKISAWIQTH